MIIYYKSITENGKVIIFFKYSKISKKLIRNKPKDVYF